MKRVRIRSVISTGALKRQVFQSIMLLLAVSALGTVFVFLFKSKIHNAEIKKSLLKDWENSSWETAYKKSLESLASKPRDVFYLTINGFAAYQMAIAQINNENSLGYMEQSIISLRKALLNKNADKDGRIRYVLGKAYYAKGNYYADLAVKYLEEAKAVSFSSGDFNEYLGLSYKEIKDYRKSVEVLTASLNPDSGEGSALLLLHIAQAYMGLEDWDKAKEYLALCNNTSKDADLTLKAKLLLGKALVNEGDTDGAIAAFEAVLETGGENAEASYELGEIYASLGETTRARAAWRRAYRSDPNFTPVLARLNAM